MTEKALVEYSYVKEKYIPLKYLRVWSFFKIDDVLCQVVYFEDDLIHCMKLHATDMPEPVAFGPEFQVIPVSVEITYKEVD